MSLERRWKEVRRKRVLRIEGMGTNNVVCMLAR